MGAAFRIAEVILRPPLTLLTKREWRGGEHLRLDRGFVAATNHISHLDALTFAHFFYDNNCPPHFLAKESLFRVPGIGKIVTAAGQIPVHRERAEASHAYSAAVAAVEAGQCVVVYPEATLTRDPALWPMVGKTGAARISLSTGCPVVPVVQWGVQEILAPYAKRPHLLPRKTVRVWAGPAVDLDDLRGLPQDVPTLREATNRILDAMTLLLGQLRQEQPPAQRWDPRVHGQPTTGDPRRTRPPEQAG